MTTIQKAILALCCCSGLTAAAQQSYTLEQCIQEALTHNVRMRQANNKVEAAVQQKKEAFTRYFPTVSADGAGLLTNNGLARMDMMGQQLTMARNGILGSVSAFMPLYAGGQIVNGNKLADVGVRVSRLQKEQTEDEVELTTQQYFWRMVVWREKLQTLLRLEQQLGQMRQDVDAAVKAGVTNRNDLLQVDLRRNEVQSQQLSVRNTLYATQHLLAQYMGHADDSLTLEYDSITGLPPRPDSLYCAPEQAVTRTAAYGLLSENVASAKLQYKMTRGKNMPTVAIGGGHFYENLLDADHSSWMGFATVSIPLTKWWGGSHEMKRSRLEVNNAEDLLADRRQCLVISVQNTWNELTVAYRQVEIAVQAIAQADENLRLQHDYYQAGTTTMSDVLEAQSLFQQSCDRFVENYANYRLKCVEYLQATGR